MDVASVVGLVVASVMAAVAGGDGELSRREGDQDIEAEEESR